jgi:hypothetical protein
MRFDLSALRAAGPILLAGCAAQPAVPGSTAPPDVVEQITAAEQAWARGIIDTDTVALGRILATEFVLTGIDSTEPPFPRAAWMTNVGTKEVYTDSVAIDSLRISGTADSAVATMRYFWRPIVRGQRMGDDWTSLRDTWVRRDGRWQAIRRQRLDAFPGR